MYELKQSNRSCGMHSAENMISHSLACITTDITAAILRNVSLEACAVHTMLRLCGGFRFLKRSPIGFRSAHHFFIAVTNFYIIRFFFIKKIKNIYRHFFFFFFFFFFWSCSYALVSYCRLRDL